MQMDRRTALEILGAGALFAPSAFAQENLSRELADLVETNYGRLPSFDDRKYDLSISLRDDERFSKRVIVNTEYGSLAFRRSEARSLPTAYAGASQTITFDNRGNVISSTLPPVTPTEPFNRDNINLIWPSGSIDIDIYRTTEPVLTLYASSDEREFDQELYLDTDLDGVPNRGYRGHGIWIHGIPNSVIVGLNTMSTDEANFFRQIFTQELRKVIEASMEYLRQNPESANSQR
jgi:hypothetical protein